jgi:site-specific DNA-cytosine methylase
MHGTATVNHVEVRHFHLFCGLGGGARGFNRGQARVGSMVARFRCIGGVDADPAAVKDFGRIAGVPGTRLDLFSRAQYAAFHGCEPPAGWREATPGDIHRAAGGERPHIVFLSAPCKGFSGLLSERQSLSGKYQALNGLTLRGVWLMLEAWSDDPPELIVFENVPRIATRGRHLLDQVVGLLRSFGYAVAETTHDCGELGGLAQSRKRFLLVARHMAKVPPFLYEPPKRPLRGVGEVLGKLPVPGPEAILPMHRMPSLQWRTWVRLAFVEAGSDWRSLNKLRVDGGVLADYGIAPDVGWQAGVMGVQRWAEPSGTVAGRSGPTNGAFSVADPRLQGKPRFNNTFRIVPWSAVSPAVAGPGGPAGGLAVADPRADSGFGGKGKYRVTGFEEPAGAVIGASTTGQGACAVADPRTGWPEGTHQSKLAVQDWERPSKTVTGSDRVGSGALCVADPRFEGRERATTYGVKGWSDPAGVVAGESFPSNGAFAVADPRPEAFKDGKESYATGGHYGVVPWDEASGAVTASGQHDNGRWSVADPRAASGEALPAAGDRLVAVIRSLDGTWHRPFTTLELAALQSLVDPEETLELDGLSDSAWRERIGNMVPPDAAEAMAGVFGRTLLLAWSGETFLLCSEPIWVRPIAVALAVAPMGEAA